MHRQFQFGLYDRVLYCAPDMPEPPDPKETAAAQTGTNISTATANAALGNVNQITPYGSLTTKQTGSQFIEDASGTKYYRGPDGKITSSAPASVFRPGEAAAPSPSTPPPWVNPALTSYRDSGEDTATLDKLQGNTAATAAGGSWGLPTGWSEVTGYNVPTYTQTQSLSPSQQKIFDQTQAAQGNLGAIANQQSAFLKDYLGKPVDLSTVPAAGDPSKIGLPQYTQFAGGPQLQAALGYSGPIQSRFGDAGKIATSYGPDDPSYASNVKAVQDALFSRLNPQIDRDRSALETSLLNQGIRVGSDAYASAMQQFNQGVNDQRTSVLLASGQEQSRLADLDAQRAGFQNAAQQQLYNQLLGRGTFSNDAQAQQFGQNLQAGTFGNSALQQMFENQNRVTGQNNQLQDQTLNASLARFNAQNQAHNQALNEAYANRSQPINEITSLLGLSQLSNPNFQNVNMPTIPTVDYAGLVNENYNQRLGIAQQQAAAQQSILGGLFGLGAAGIMASDRRVKKDIKKVGNLKGQNVYEFRYKGEKGPKHVGFMAQEVERDNPDAVMEIGGVKHIHMPTALTGLFGLGAKGGGLY